jgi:hypothetical protein
MAANESTIYQCVNDYFKEKRSRMDKFKLNEYSYRASLTIDSDNFIYFSMESEIDLFDNVEVIKDSRIGQMVCDYGLKFHVSIPEWSDELYNKGFDLLLPFLMEQKVEFKILKSNLKMSDQTGQAGKDITIYANATPEKSLENWTDLITGITTILVKNGVPPGYLSEGVKQKPESRITGCNYITYRYEKERNKKNVRLKTDPVASIKIEVPDQEKPKCYVRQDESPQSRVSLNP